MDGAEDSFGLAGEPPGETQGVVDLSMSLGDRLARLVGQNGCDVVLVFPDQIVPVQEPACPLT